MKAFLHCLAISLLATLVSCSNNVPAPVEPAEPGPEPWTGEIPVELVRYFAGGGSFHDTLPPGFPPFSLPSSFQVLGSKNVDAGDHVLLGTTLEAGQARDAVAEAFLAEGGWRVMEPRSNISRTVFSPARPPAIPTAGNDETALVLCHDEHGTLGIQAPYIDEDVISLGRTGIEEGQTGSYCQQQVEIRSRIRSSPLDRFQPWQPRLQAPEGELTDGSRGGGSDGMSTEALLRTENTSLSELAHHFAIQMENQGWVLETDWRGEISAGSAWSFRPEEEAPLSGFLNIVERSDSEFSLKFRMAFQETN